jgi:hypothetical protein
MQKMHAGRTKKLLKMINVTDQTYSKLDLKRGELATSFYNGEI